MNEHSKLDFDFDDDIPTINIDHSEMDMEFADDNSEYSDMDEKAEIYPDQESGDHNIPTSCVEDKPLYINSLLAIGNAMLLIITFFIHHSLSRKALCDLLTLISLLTVVANIYLKSFYDGEV